MKKNVVFIVNIKEQKRPGRSEGFEYSVKSWKHWCDKNNFDLFTLTDRVYDEDFMNANWHKTLALEILDNSNINYDQVLIVDCDTIVHPECPNFFKETENKLCGVMNDGCYEWVLRSLNLYSKKVFDNIWVNPWDYFNTGWIIVNKSHKKFLQEVIKFYENNQEKLVKLQKDNGLGTDQTPFNFLVKKYNIDFKIMPQCYNLHQLERKNLLYFHPQHWWGDNFENLYKSAWVYHFNSIPPNPLNRGVDYFLKKTYEELWIKK